MTNLGLTDEQRQLAEVERSWLSRHDPIASLRAVMDRTPVTIDGPSVSHAAESGLLALLTDSLGGTHADLAVFSEEHGYAASSLPAADLAIAAWALAVATAPEADAAAAGEQLVGIASGPGAVLNADGLNFSDGGVTSPVPMAADLGSVAVVGLTPDAEYLAVLAAPDLQVMSTLDITRTWARICVPSPLAQWVALPPGTLSHISEALAVHRALDATGAAARLLDMTVAYAGQRHQFGAPIGSFQAVKHHCADMAVAVEASRAVLRAAVEALDVASSAQRHRIVSAAVAYAKSAASRVAASALQVHGGIGFTWEHDLHLFMRRIKVDEALNGTVASHRAALVSA